MWLLKLSEHQDVQVADFRKISVTPAGQFLFQDEGAAIPLLSVLGAHSFAFALRLFKSMTPLS